MAYDSDIDDGPRLYRRGKACAGEMLGAAKFTGFDQHLPPCANLRLKVTVQRRFAFFAQSASTFLDDIPVDLRHTRSGGAGPGRERKHVQMREPARID